MEPAPPPSDLIFSPSQKRVAWLRQGWWSAREVPLISVVCVWAVELVYICTNFHIPRSMQMPFSHTTLFPPPPTTPVLYATHPLPRPGWLPIMLACTLGELGTLEDRDKTLRGPKVPMYVLPINGTSIRILSSWGVDELPASI